MNLLTKQRLKNKTKDLCTTQHVHMQCINCIKSIHYIGNVAFVASSTIFKANENTEIHRPVIRNF